MPLLDGVRWRGMEGQKMQFRLAAGVKLSTLQLHKLDDTWCYHLTTEADLRTF